SLGCLLSLQLRPVKAATVQSFLPAKSISREPRRGAAVLRIAIACVPYLLDRAVSPVSHAESLMVAVPAVGPEWLSESFGPGRPFEYLEESFGKSEDSPLPCCSQTSPHLWQLRCHSSEFQRFP